MKKETQIKITLNESQIKEALLIYTQGKDDDFKTAQSVEVQLNAAISEDDTPYDFTAVLKMNY